MCPGPEHNSLTSEALTSEPHGISRPLENTTRTAYNLYVHRENRLELG